MSLTRKHYVMLAEALHDARPIVTYGVYVTSHHAHNAWAQCVDSVSAVLAADNPRFDRARFIKAAQGEK